MRDGRRAERLLLLRRRRRAPCLLSGRLSPLRLRSAPLLVLGRVLLWRILRRILRARVLLRVQRWVALRLLAGMVLAGVALAGVALLLLRRARVCKFLHLRLAFCEQLVERAGHGEVRTADG
jgi:hypothetical protein